MLPAASSAKTALPNQGVCWFSVAVGTWWLLWLLLEELAQHIALLGVRLPVGHRGHDAECGQGGRPHRFYKSFSPCKVEAGELLSVSLLGLLKHACLLYVSQVRQKSQQLLLSLMLVTVLC